MIEASFTVPLLILMVLSLIMLLVFEYQCFKGQIDLHESLITSFDESDAVFDIEKKYMETSSEVEGIVERWFSKSHESRIYVFSPTECIRLGEMLSFDES